MAKAYLHAISSAKKFGGIPEDYIDIHNLLDSSKSIVADNRHRVLTHNSWFISTIIERIYGITLLNSDGKQISTRDVAEQHVLEDFGGNFIPSAQDYLQEINYKEWMNGNGYPASRIKIEQNMNQTFISFMRD